jgi:hypothetical protein
MEDRPLFSTEEGAPYLKAKVVMSTGGDVAFYMHFALTLPKGARIKRGEPNAIVIDTDRFVLTFNIDFGGFGTIIPWEYHRHILGLDPRECDDYQISVRFKVLFKFASLFLPGGWEYYRWLESFMESFNAKFSKDRHFAEIGWESALTLIQYHEMQKSKSEGKESQQAN